MLEDYQFNVARKYKNGRILDEKDVFVMERLGSIGLTRTGGLHVRDDGSVERTAVLTPLGKRAVRGEEINRSRWKSFWERMYSLLDVC